MDLIGPAASALSSLTWAIAIAIYSRLAHQYSAPAINFARAAVAFPFALVIGLLISGPHAFITAWHTLGLASFSWLASGMVCGFALGDVIYLYSTKAMGVQASLAIASIYPLWSALAGALFADEVLSPLRIAGVLLVVMGTVIVILAGYRAYLREGGSQGDGKYFKGVCLAILASLFWGGNTYVTMRGATGLDLNVSTPLRLAIAAFLCPIIGIFFVPRQKLFLPVSEMKKNIGIFLLEGLCGSYLYIYGLSHTPLSIAGPLSALAPAMSAPIAWFMGSERFSATKFLGILIVLAGIFALVS